MLATLTAGSAARAQSFVVHRASDDSVAYSGTLTSAKPDRDTTLDVQQADFSALKDPGTYYLEVPGVGRSVAFRIGADVYDGELATVMAGFYGWRAGVKVSLDHHGVHFGHEAGHLTDALLNYAVDGGAGITKDGVGGWYDAGDYGKYLPTAAESVVTMLAAWELFQDKLVALELPFLPEHGGPIPDYLSEVKWELDWMLKMVYSDGTGRVHHKINSPSFPGFVQPAADPTTRYFSTFSTAATAEFVAAMAKAARAFAPYDSVTDNYSQTLLRAAQASYAYLKANPGDVQYDSSVLKAGSYLKKDPDDRMWAAAELYETTGDADVLADFESRINLDAAQPASFVANPDWDTTLDFALLPYTLSKRTDRTPALAKQAASRLDFTAKAIRDYHDESGYGRGFDKYYWGSNGIVARTCLLLQSAYSLNPDSTYLDVCADQIGYLYGRNQYNRSQVTGAGIDPPLHIHHRPSAADEITDPYPGLLAGGGQTATGWQDLQSSYNTNEVAINWNSALVFALAGFIQGSGATPSFGVGPVTAADCGVRLNSAGYLPERTKVATVQKQCDAATASFACTMGPTTMSGDTSGPPSIIDDMEDGDDQILASRGRQGQWFAFDDKTGGTRSEVSIQSVDRSGSQHAACITASGFTSWGGGFGFPLAAADANRQAYDASAYTGLTFWARGSSTAAVRVMLVDKFSNPAAGNCSACDDNFYFSFTPSSEWKQYTFKWKSAAQLGFGDQQPSVCPSALYTLQFQWLNNATVDMCLDDIAFTTAAGSADAGTAGDASSGGGQGNGGDGDNGGGDGNGGKGGAAGSTSRRGAGGQSDSDESEETSTQSGGCKCSIGPGAQARFGTVAALGGLALLLARRRRRSALPGPR